MELPATLRQESENLARSWLRHDEGVLRDYLVADVEDPRINVQSILTRHFLVFAATGRPQALADLELQFAACVNWLLALAKETRDATAFESVLYALRRGADNADGTELPPFLRRAFAALPTPVGDQVLANYIEDALRGTSFDGGQARLPQPVLDTFQTLWRGVLAVETPPRLTVLEPACGSANDYRFLAGYGIARLLDYAGFDLCEKNVANARGLFPGARFETGNVFDIPAPAKSIDCCFVHDLFEHLSMEGMERAAQELCRVTRRGLCLHFFNMDEIPEHRVLPVDEYHWNTLSLDRVRELFAAHGFQGQAFHIGTFLRWRAGCDQTHNPNAYTLVLGAATENAGSPTAKPEAPT